MHDVILKSGDKVTIAAFDQAGPNAGYNLNSYAVFAKLNGGNWFLAKSSKSEWKAFQCLGVCDNLDDAILMLEIDLADNFYGS